MPTSRFFRWHLALLCTLSTTAFAQTTPPASSAAPSVSDPSAPVPELSYRSVFKETSLGVERDSDDWRKANDDVGKFLRGHIDILKWEEQQSAQPLQPSMPPKPAMAPGMDKAIDAPTAPTKATAVPPAAPPAAPPARRPVAPATAPAAAP
jgi:hypothetical protein